MKSYCIVIANRETSQPELPVWYVIKFCILIACALKDWKDAEPYWNGAEQRYWNALARATKEQDKKALMILQGLREELDEPSEFRDKDLAAGVGLDITEWDAEDAGWFEYEREVANAKKKLKKSMRPGRC